jgi:serine/threonine protein kinase
VHDIIKMTNRTLTEE